MTTWMQNVIQFCTDSQWKSFLNPLCTWGTKQNKTDMKHRSLACAVKIQVVFLARYVCEEILTLSCL